MRPKPASCCVAVAAAPAVTAALEQGSVAGQRRRPASRAGLPGAALRDHGTNSTRARHGQLRSSPRQHSSGDTIRCRRRQRPAPAQARDPARSMRLARAARRRGINGICSARCSAFSPHANLQRGEWARPRPLNAGCKRPPNQRPACGREGPGRTLADACDGRREWTAGASMCRRMQRRGDGLARRPRCQRRPRRFYKRRASALRPKGLFSDFDAWIDTACVPCSRHLLATAAEHC